jgi:glycine/D-amino acid oxidase-like deaminating enzyme
MNVSHERTRSLWMDVTVDVAPRLDRNESADVAIVGSGITGLSVAYELAARGATVVVLDRADIGTGMTARTTAHLASAFDDGYAELIKSHGRDGARLVYRSQAAAIAVLSRKGRGRRNRRRVLLRGAPRTRGTLFIAPRFLPDKSSGGTTWAAVCCYG